MLNCVFMKIQLIEIYHHFIGYSILEVGESIVSILWKSSISFFFFNIYIWVMYFFLTNIYMLASDFVFSLNIQSNYY